MIVVIGEILIDVFETYQRIGGAPFNFAFHLRQLGWPVRFFSRVGNDANGRKILSLLEKHDFNLEDVQIDTHYPTGTVHVSLDTSGVPKFDIRRDVAYDYLDLSGPAAAAAHAADLIYFGSLVQRTPFCFGQVSRFFTERGTATKLFCDINLRPPHVNFKAVQDALHAADIVKLNEEERKIISDRFGAAGAEQDAQWMLRAFDIELIVETKGAQGSAVHTKKQVLKMSPVHNSTVIDTVGAGDAFAAVMAAGYLKKCDLQMTLAAASDFAARICGLPGAVPEQDAPYRALNAFAKGDADVG